MPNKEGRWVTINGRAIFIGEGQSLEEAMNSKGQVKKADTAKKKSNAPSYGPKASNLEKGMKIKAPDGEIFTVSKVEKNGSRVYVDLKKKDGSWYSDLGYDADEEVLGPFGTAYYKDNLDSWKAEKAAAESGDGGSKGSSSQKTAASAAKPSRSAAKSAIAKKAGQGSTDMTEWAEDEKQPVFEYYYNKEFTTDEAEYDITESINEDIRFDYDGYIAYAKKRNKELGVNNILW